jgi:D-amino peptidase
MKRAIVVLLVAVWVLAGEAAQKKGLKVFISVDMEGIWGVVNSEQTSPGGDYGHARSWMAGDTNAVVDGLLDGGATEIVVNDSHGSMRNIVASELNPKASLITGTPKPLSMMQGIDSSFDAALLIGYHARAGSAPAILDHTISGGSVRAVRINGKELPEMGINGAIAGYYGVPVVMLSGDSETCAQAKAVFGGEIVTAAVKEAIGRTAARLLPLEEARRRLKEAAREALAKRGSIPPYKLSPPFAFELELNTSLQAEPAMLIPGVKRANPRTVTFGATDYIEGFKLLRGLIALAAAS